MLYRVTELSRLERIKAHRRGLRNKCALLECIQADKAKDKVCQDKVNAEYKKKIEMKEQEIKDLRQKITGIKKSPLPRINSETSDVVAKQVDIFPFLINMYNLNDDISYRSFLAKTGNK